MLPMCTQIAEIEDWELLLLNTQQVSVAIWFCVCVHVCTCVYMCFTWWFLTLKEDVMYTLRQGSAISVFEPRSLRSVFLCMLYV